MDDGATGTLRNVEWTRGPGQVLSGFAYHDGTIVEANLVTFQDGSDSQTRTLTLGIRNLNQQVVSVQFRDLADMNVAELTLDAIVNDIEVRNAANGRGSDGFWAEFWEVLLPASRVADMGRRGEGERMLAKYPDHYFVRLYASYGGSIALICRDITVREL